MQELEWYTYGWQWHGLQWGNGSHMLICFHGFGEDASRFQVLEQAWGRDFTIIAIDLPFHGRTRQTIASEALPRLVDWQELMQQIMHQFHQQQCYLMGYSLGGRVCLQLTQQMPQHIRSLILLAPDGLHHNFWFYFLTRTYIGKKLFRWHVDHPKLFFTITTYLEKIKLLSPSLKKFLEVQMNTREKRMLVLQSWNSLRAFVPDLAVIKENISQYAISCYLFFGKYDRVIQSKHGKRFCSDLPKAHMCIMDCGHQLLTEETAWFIKQQIDQPS